MLMARIDAECISILLKNKNVRRLILSPANVLLASVKNLIKIISFIYRIEK